MPAACVISCHPLPCSDAIWFRPPCQGMKSTQGGTGVENLQGNGLAGETSRHQVTGHWFRKPTDLGLGVLYLGRWFTKYANDIQWYFDALVVVTMLQSISSPVSIAPFATLGEFVSTFETTPSILVVDPEETSTFSWNRNFKCSYMFLLESPWAKYPDGHWIWIHEGKLGITFLFFGKLRKNDDNKYRIYRSRVKTSRLWKGPEN